MGEQVSVLVSQRKLTIALQAVLALLLWAAFPAAADVRAPMVPSVEVSRGAAFLPGLNENEADDHQTAVAAVFSVQAGDDDDPRATAWSYLVFAVVPRDAVVSDLPGLRGVTPQTCVRAIPPTGPPSA